MAIVLNHTIVRSRDKEASAQSYLNKHLMKMVKSKTEEKLKLVAK